MRNRLYWKPLISNIKLSSRILKAGQPAFSYVSPLRPKVNLNIIGTHCRRLRNRPSAYVGLALAGAMIRLQSGAWRLQRGSGDTSILYELLYELCKYCCGENIRHHHPVRGTYRHTQGRCSPAQNHHLEIMWQRERAESSLNPTLPPSTAKLPPKLLPPTQCRMTEWESTMMKKTARKSNAMANTNKLKQLLNLPTQKSRW